MATGMNDSVIDDCRRLEEEVELFLEVLDGVIDGVD